VKPARTAHRLGAVLVAPALVTLAVVILYPLGHALWLSLHRLRLTDPGGQAFVGLENYRVALGDGLFWTDTGRTLLLVVLTVPVEVALGLAVALVLHRASRARGWVRAAALVPYGMVTVVSALSFRYALDPATGFVNGWLGLGELAWFDSRATALAAICVAEIWKTTPFVALLLLAGLSLVPEELSEAARLDGAGAAQRLFRITLPIMRGPLAVAVLFRALDAFRIFDSVFVMTGGAQGTETLSILAYRQTIGRTALGLGSTVSVLMFAGVLLLGAAVGTGLRVGLDDGLEGR